MKRMFGEVLEKVLGQATEVERVQAVGGGSINRCYRVDAGSETYFVKENSHSLFPGMFEAEMKGLKLLRQHASFHIPCTFGVAGTGDQRFLVMEYLSPGAPASDFWEVFGQNLALMHKVNSPHFGLDHHNYIGSLQQQNTFCDTWNTFFAEQRIMPQMRQAREQHLLETADVQAFERLFGRLDEFFGAEPPSLLHGDLWSGNFVIDNSGLPALIDPAVYYGHRLMDIGMSRLFGGFDNSMYESYHRHYPLPANWQEAIEVCNLYPLLVHLNLFGESYVSQVRSILNRYT